MAPSKHGDDDRQLGQMDTVSQWGVDKSRNLQSPERSGWTGTGVGSLDRGQCIRHL